MKVINKKVIKYSEIPTDLTKALWFNGYPSGVFVEVHIDDSTDEVLNELDEWLIQSYPGIENEDSFFIELDY